MNRTTYDVEKATQICALVAEGNFLSNACASVGYIPRIVFRWLQWGEEGKEPYAEFAANVAKARADFAIRATRLLDDKSAAPAHSKNLQWLLAHLQPNKYGERVQIHVRRELDGFLDRLKEQLPAEVYERVLRIAAGESGGEEAGEQSE